RCPPKPAPRKIPLLHFGLLLGCPEWHPAERLRRTRPPAQPAKPRVASSCFSPQRYDSTPRISHCTTVNKSRCLCLRSFAGRNKKTGQGGLPGKPNRTSAEVNVRASNNRRFCLTSLPVAD